VIEVYGVRLCLGARKEFGIPVEDQIRLFHQVGFDGFFTVWDGKTSIYREIANELGMIYQSVHAPFDKMKDIWHDPVKSADAVNELLACVDECGANAVPILIVHAYIGFEPNPGPTAMGIENFRKVVDRAREQNVKIAFENTEGEEYLAALMEAFGDDEAVGFCWDSGHELCYNQGRDMLGKYGHRLIGTHLNDNLGISDFNGITKPVDDLHLLPFDGVVDWDNAICRLHKCGYKGFLTFELKLHSNPGRHEHDKYRQMSIESYITEIYARACRVGTMYRNHK